MVKARVAAVALSVAVLATVTACGGGSTTNSASSSTSTAAGPKLVVVSTINAWGSIAAQLGGDRVQATSIITNPDTDPHDYEPAAGDARSVATARVVVENGIGYDAWADKLIASNPNPQRTVINVGDTVGVPKDGNPHQWYSPDSVNKVIDAITNAYKTADPADASYFDQQRQQYLDQGLAKYHQEINTIKSSYAGTPIGASESIVSPLSDALGLQMLTPAEFLKAISEGTDPSPADKATVDQQIANKAIKVYVFNSQNSTPDIQAQVDAAKKQGIPVTTVTETLAPASTTFQDWQTGQLTQLADALHTATGK